VASANSEKVQKLYARLFNYLNEVEARFPEKDPEYDVRLEKEHLENVELHKLPQLEKQRLKILAKDFDPGNNWWGSHLTQD
jgi:hypothetical protein